ncbi:hypothetical protein B9Z55_011555 [Caenorhabditis nigoni]|nr:hypothetical protein B9Z55_011555 [Caenorhabditis nigoni]
MLWTLQLNVDCANDISGRYIISAKYPLTTVEFSGELQAGATILTTDDKMVETGMLSTRSSEFRVDVILNRSLGMEIPLKRSLPPVTLEISDKTVKMDYELPRKQDQHFPLLPNVLRHLKANFQKIRTNWRRFWKTPITIRLSKKKPEPYLEEDTEYVCYIPV